MRSPENKLDTARGNRKLKVKRKFILAFEGYRTEVQYFKGVSDNRSGLGIPSLIEVCPLERYPIQSGSSDPEKVLELLEEYIKFLKCGKYSLDLFISTFITHIIPENGIIGVKNKIDEFKRTAKESLQTLCSGNDLISDTDKAKEICSEIYYKVFEASEKIHFDVPESIDYREDRDVICVIVDRDADSRDSSKCNEFFSRCRKSNFEPYMTNPCFEMWLLLHFDEVLDENREILLQNEMIDGKRYTERRLDEILMAISKERNRYSVPEEKSGYFKNDLDFSSFMHRVDDAIKNEKEFCNDINCIKANAGSNIGSLIEKMRHHD